MRLKRVRVFGFKTFADRTEVNLEGNIVAVVGPNGCGKSNLVDAILWGLGEGNARQLRAQTGQDVIFNGSSKRKAVGLAEVTLIFDNEDGALPVATSEVSITRRLTRGGDTEYSINRQSCRLRDVYELLADSGLGRSGYSIVGQKEIDSALSASADDRRGWIDEAAGVQRYRARKIESLRRLSAAQDHLSRVADIVREIDSQREPLRVEAERAHRFKQLQETLREVEVGLLVTEAAATVTELAELEARLAAAAHTAVAESARAEALEAEADRISARALEVEGRIAQLRAAHQAAVIGQGKAESALALAEQKLASLNAEQENLAESGALLEARKEVAQREVATAQEERTAATEAVRALREELGGAGEEAARLRAQLSAAELALTEARQQEQRRLKQVAEREHAGSRVAALDRELEGIRQTIPDLDAAIAEADAELQTSETGSTTAQAKIQDWERQRKEVQTAEERDAKSVRDALGQKAALEGRRRGIESTIDAHEGLTQGSRAVMEAAERGILRGSYVPVGQAIEADRDLALAIETGLGGAANDLIVPTDADAKEAIAWLKEHRAGRATFQPIPLMRPFEPSYELNRLMGERGVQGRASELVSCDPRHRPVIDSLLGRVVIVDEIDTALRLAKTHGWSRMVTLEGEVVHSGGAVTGGQAARQGYGLVQRKADLAELNEELAKIAKTVGEFERRSRDRQTKLDELARLVREELNAGKEAAIELEERRKFLRSLQDERRTTQKELERLEREKAGLLGGETAEIAALDLPTLEANRDEILKKVAAHSADADVAEARLREADTAAERARTAATAAEKRLEHVLWEEKARQRKAENLAPLRDELRAEIATSQEDLAAAKEAQQLAERDIKTENQSLSELRDAILEKTLEARKCRETVASLNAAQHQTEIQRARAESRRGVTFARLLEDYGLGEEESLRMAPGVVVPEDAAGTVNRLRRDLRSMGDVNLGAIDAYERLRVRFEELSAQVEDINGGIREVRASISELDKLTRDRFLTTFAAVQVAFSEVTQKLFGGGSGELTLTEPENLLESGIALDVTLPGKKRQPLALLSGGERSLCATAFLFSLLRVKPSPLVVLDEVDAPLDGRNVERFAAMLQEFSLNTQFIVITHNPTTIEAAPVWLGVTMQEPGISTLVPARLKDAREMIGGEPATG